MIGPPAPWSVPAESDSSRRRPNSENTIVTTFCSTPRVARSALNAASARESVVSCGSCPASWAPCVSKLPQSIVITRVPRPAESSVAASCSFCERPLLGG